jgi:hypothetical protein
MEEATKGNEREPVGNSPCMFFCFFVFVFFFLQLTISSWSLPAGTLTMGLSSRSCASAASRRTWRLLGRRYGVTGERPYSESYQERRRLGDMSSPLHWGIRPLGLGKARV